MALGIPDELLSALVPIGAFWFYSGLYVVLGPYLQKYKLHTKEEEEKNMATKLDIFKGVVIEHTGQLALVPFTNLVPKSGGGEVQPQPPLPVQLGQIFVGMVVLDTYLYFTHRLFHVNTFLYKHFHSHHHRLYVTYPYVAQYNHPLESIVLIVGTIVAFLASGMTKRTSIFLYSIGAVKAVDDHCGYYIPWHPIQWLFEANSAYHDVHHQLHGLKSNFSTPFFSFWDKVMGTYMPYEIVEGEGGGYEVKLLKEKE